MLIVNADDYGFNPESTDKILSCFSGKRIHSASAMAFMSDSERAADLARETELPLGLHLNFNEPFTGSTTPSTLREYHQKISAYLNARKLNQILYNPFLRQAFDYVIQAQWEEYTRLYHSEPQRVDGHRHLHLCMNALLSARMPKGIRLRRNFTFRPGEKSLVNRLYRSCVDRWVKWNFACTDSFFDVNPVGVGRIQRLIAMSETSDVEIMVHPGRATEYDFLLSRDWERLVRRDGFDSKECRT